MTSLAAAVMATVRRATCAAPTMARRVQTTVRPFLARSYEDYLTAIRPPRSDGEGVGIHSWRNAEYGYSMPPSFARIGLPAPDFEAGAVVDGEITKLKLSDYKGKWVCLFFYPKGELVSLARACASFGVASPGSALTVSHAQLLS